MGDGLEATLATLRAELQHELTVRILPFWMREAVDRVHGGFAGFIDAQGVVATQAPKGGILNARILWAFSAAYRRLHAPEHAAVAGQAAVYFASHFMDPIYGGIFWMIDAKGRPIDDRKHVYAQAFAIYALAEYHRALGDETSLRDAIGLFRLVEAHAHDSERGGYHEAFSRDWRRLDDVRLSDEDLNTPKSMNTHLHLLEAYTALHKAWPNTVLRARITELLELFLGTIIAPGGRRMSSFFDADWRPTTGATSFGHDIEASWLLVEAAEETKYSALIERVRCACLALATAVLEDGFDTTNGGIYVERAENGAIDMSKEWWPQAEGIVGFVNAYELTGDRRFLDSASATWAFARDHMRDMQHGEWFRRVSRDGAPDTTAEKVGPWKCPYHNARACLEVLERLSERPTDGIVEVTP